MNRDWTTDSVALSNPAQLGSGQQPATALVDGGVYVAGVPSVRREEADALSATRQRRGMVCHFVLQ